MAIAFRASSTAAVGATLSIDPGLPAGTVATDVLIAFIGSNTDQLVSAPIGWNVIRRDFIAGNVDLQSFWALGNVASTNFTVPVAANERATINGYSGVANAVPIDVHNGLTGNTTTPTAPSVTTTIANDWSIAGMESRNAAFTAVLSNAFTERTNVGAAGTRQKTGDKGPLAIGPTGNTTSTFAAATRWAGQQIALAPAAAVFGPDEDYQWERRPPLLEPEVSVYS